MFDAAPSDCDTAGMASKPAAKKAAPLKTKAPTAPKKRVGIAAPAPKAKPKSAPKAKPAPKRKAPDKPKATVKKAAPVAAAAPEGQLSPRVELFIAQYLIDLNATQAAIRAGYSAKTAQEQSSRLLSNAMVQAAVAKARQAQQERLGIEADRVVMEAWHIATADPRELVALKVGCCRYCYGEGHKYQRTLSEYNLDREQHSIKGEGDFDERGGIGYNPLLEPLPGCPQCHGDGHPRVVLGDTRKLGGAAAALYAGAKQTKYGIEVLTHSKMDALEKLMKHLGLYERDNQQKTDPLASLLHAIASGNDNGFKPKAEDPERGKLPPPKSSAFAPRIDSERGK